MFAAGAAAAAPSDVRAVADAAAAERLALLFCKAAQHLATERPILPREYPYCYCYLIFNKPEICVLAVSRKETKAAATAITAAAAAVEVIR
jgi:hypothetical protein